MKGPEYFRQKADHYQAMSDKQSGEDAWALRKLYQELATQNRQILARLVQEASR